jgi:hypothetical protein
MNKSFDAKNDLICSWTLFKESNDASIIDVLKKSGVHVCIEGQNIEMTVTYFEYFEPYIQSSVTIRSDKMKRKVCSCPIVALELSDDIAVEVKLFTTGELHIRQRPKTPEEFNLKE